MTFLFPYMARWNSANMSRYYHLFNKMADLGHTVIVVQPPARASDETNYIDLPLRMHPNISLITVRIPLWLWSLKLPIDKFVKKGLYTIASYFLIRRLTALHRPNVLVLYNMPQVLYTVGNDVAIVFDYADDYTAMFQHELGVGPKNLLVRVGASMLCRLTRKALLVTCVSEVLHQKVNHSNTLLLPNGADLSPFNGERTNLHIDRSKPVIGYVGAFEYFIDLELMLDAAGRFPAYTFLYVGAGRRFAWFKEQVVARKLNNIIMTGAVPHHQAMQFISEMDICLNLFAPGPVADAASPIKLFEYFSNGKPVITTRLKETLRIDESMRALSYADNLAELAERIEFLLTHKNDVAEKIERARAQVETTYNWGSIAQTFVSKLEGSLPSPSEIPRKATQPS